MRYEDYTKEQLLEIVRWWEERALGMHTRTVARPLIERMLDDPERPWEVNEMAVALGIEAKVVAHAFQRLRRNGWVAGLGGRRTRGMMPAFKWLLRLPYCYKPCVFDPLPLAGAPYGAFDCPLCGMRVTPGETHPKPTDGEADGPWQAMQEGN